MAASSFRARLSRLPLVAYKRWQIRVGFPLHRSLLGRRVDGFEPGAVTVVTVNWNTLPYLRTMCEMVRRHSPSSTRIVVVDNASTDGSREWIRSNPDVVGRLLPYNVHHGPAADLGALLVRTEFLVLLDVDAFPFSDGWLPAVLEPLRAGATVAGGHIHRNYVHPSFLAMRMRDFVRRRHSFTVVGRWHRGVTAGEGGFRDAGEDISIREREQFGPGATHLIPVTSTRGPGLLGTVFGDVVYHNFFSTGYGGSSEWSDETTSAWEDAVAEYVDGG